MYIKYFLVAVRINGNEYISDMIDRVGRRKNK